MEAPSWLMEEFQVCGGGSGSLGLPLLLPHTHTHILYIKGWGPTSIEFPHPIVQIGNWLVWCGEMWDVYRKWVVVMGACEVSGVGNGKC